MSATEPMNMSTSQCGPIIWTLAQLFIIYRLGTIVYRLYFHPLSKFPGPKLAAASTLYRAYYQIWRDGDHVAQATRLHETYGPVVRVTPNTLHFRNPTAFHDIFRIGSKLTKDAEFYDHLGQSDALFGMVDEERHKERFKLVADMFSKRWACNFETSIDKNTERFCDLLFKASDKGKTPVNIARGFRAVALDIIQDFVFDQVPAHLRGLLDEKFDTLFVHTTFDVMDWTAWCFRNFPLSLEFSNKLPQWLRRILFPGEAANIESFEEITKIVQDNLACASDWHRDSILSRMAGKIDLQQMTSECMGTMFGGVINMANMLPYGAFRVCTDEALQQRVYEELVSIWPDPNEAIPAFDRLVNLPILTGVVKESLRLMHGIIVGPPRRIPASGAQIDNIDVPPNTVVTTSSLYCHTNPEVFPEPDGFKPERWANATPEMEKNLVPFSKGRRMCPGKEISIMELYIVFAAVLRRFRLHAYNTTLQDFQWKVYISLHFKGRYSHALLMPRDGFVGRPVETLTGKA